MFGFNGVCIRRISGFAKLRIKQNMLAQTDRRSKEGGLVVYLIYLVGQMNLVL